jgi:hypothetical protein
MAALSGGWSVLGFEIGGARGRRIRGVEEGLGGNAIPTDSFFFLR